ncbi:Adenylate cyclase [Diplonema papillatum]|nr:Adenylate cyclase [Diplonema papillatum]
MWSVARVVAALTAIHCVRAVEDCDAATNMTIAPGEDLLKVFALFDVDIPYWCDEYLAWLNTTDFFIKYETAFSTNAGPNGVGFDRFASVAEMLLRKDASLVDVLYLDAPWVGALQEHLVDFDTEFSSDGVDGGTDFREKLIHKSTLTGKPIAAAVGTGQIVFYYRKDLFDRHNVTWPETLDEFTETVRVVQEGERALRQAQNASEQFSGFLLPTDSDDNRLAYLLVTLLSGDDGGGIVEDDGRVTINNENAVRTLRRWKAWFDDIVPYRAFDMSTSDARNAFLRDEAAVIVAWSHDSSEFATQNKQSNWVIEAAPVPGKNGAGCSGHWSLAINKYGNVAHAQRFIQFYLDHVEYKNLRGSDNTEPYTRKLIEDPTMWSQYKTFNPVIATSMEKYPAFWDRLVHRPSGGCKAIYTNCAATIYKNVLVNYLRKDDGDPAVIVRQLEIELKTLLGHIEVVYPEREEWTSTRVMLIVVSGVCFIAMLLLSVQVIRSVSNLRHIGRFAVPLSIVLGTIVFVFLACGSTALIVIQTNALQDMSTRLSSDVRVQSLRAMETTLTVTLELYWTSAYSTLQIIQYAVARSKNEINTMSVDAQSLIVLLDRTTTRVLISSDLSKQNESVRLVDDEADRPVHPWLQKMAETFPAWQTSPTDISRIYSLPVDGDIIFNMHSFVAGDDVTNRTDTKLLLLYMTPESVVMGETDEAIARSLDVSIMLTLCGVVAAVALAVQITRPLIMLAEQLEMVRSMEIDRVSIGTNSTMLEVSVLLSGFHSMCLMLAQYKSFLPRTLFEESDTILPRFGRQAPCDDGRAAIVFTDIQGSTQIWEAAPSAMKTALDLHNKIVRDCIYENNGFEAKTIGDAFMVAFALPTEACAFGLAAQEALQAADTWPAELHDIEPCRKQSGWNGLRIRVGIAYGEVDVQEAPITGRADYFGTTVNKAARIEGCSVGGAVALTEETLEYADDMSLGNPIEIRIGLTKLRGLQEEENLVLLIPASLARRQRVITEALAARMDLSNPLSKRTGCYPPATTAALSPFLAPQVAGKSLSYEMSLPEVMRDNLTRTRGSTLVTVRLGNGHLNDVPNPFQCISEMLTSCITSVERSQGTVVSVTSGSIVLAWNTAKMASAHVNKAAYFAGVFHRALQSSRTEAWVQHTNIGMATGPVLYGNVRASESKYVMVLGTAMELSNNLAASAKDVGAFCLCASLPGSSSLVLEPLYKGLLRPIDSWVVAGTSEDVVVYQLRADHGRFDVSELYSGGLASRDWAWSKEYFAAFAARDASLIRTMANDDDVIAMRAAMLLSTQNHLRKPLTPGLEASTTPHPFCDAAPGTIS